ncbi:MAG: glycerophosphodiester phosphodiesterase family protein [Pirellulaceae bacterium]
MSTASLIAAEATPARKLVQTEGVLIVAHRGNSSVAPENTLPAFAKAIDAKSDLVELDYHHSADGVPIVIHDEILDRTTNSQVLWGKDKLLVQNVPLAELQRLDAGTWFDETFASARLPTLAESLVVIQAGSTTLIERKAGDAATLVKLLEKEKLIDRVVVQAFDWEFVRACRELSPTLALCTLSGKGASDEQIKAAAATGADVIVWNHEKLRRGQIDLIHSLGKKAWVYTIDDPQRAAEFMAAGIDGVITNKPATMIRVREQFEQSKPPAGP